MDFGLYTNLLDETGDATASLRLELSRQASQVSAPVRICAKITDLNLPLPADAGACLRARRQRDGRSPFSELVGAAEAVCLAMMRPSPEGTRWLVGRRKVRSRGASKPPNTRALAAPAPQIRGFGPPAQLSHPHLAP